MEMPVEGASPDVSAGREKKVSATIETKGSVDPTKLSALLVSIAALLVSGSSMYQSYLNRVYSEETNRPVLAVSMGQSSYFPSKGWLIAWVKIENKGKTTALHVTESKSAFSQNGMSCSALLASPGISKLRTVSILPLASEEIVFLIQIPKDCVDEFNRSDPIPPVSGSLVVTYTDRAGTPGEQELHFQITNVIRQALAPIKPVTPK